MIAAYIITGYAVLILVLSFMAIRSGRHAMSVPDERQTGQIIPFPQRGSVGERSRRAG